MPHQASPLARQQRIYRSLLLVYPRAFRQVYGADMVQVFGDKLREERTQSGRRAGLVVWLRTLLDLFKSAPIQRMEKRMSKEAAFAIAFTLMIVVAAVVFMEGVGGLAINIGLGIAIIAALGLGVSGFFNKNRNSPPAAAGKLGLRDWWVVLAAIAGALQLLSIIVEVAKDPTASNLAALAIVGGLGALLVAGAWVRTKRRNVGDWMIVIGILPWAGLWWMIFPVVIALVIIVMAILDTLRAPRSSEPVAA